MSAEPAPVDRLTLALRAQVKGQRKTEKNRRHRKNLLLKLRNSSKPKEIFPTKYDLLHRIAALLEEGYSIGAVSRELLINRWNLAYMIRWWRPCICPQCNRAVFGRRREGKPDFIGVICGHWVQEATHSDLARNEIYRWNQKEFRFEENVVPVEEGGRDKPEQRLIGPPIASVILVARVSATRQRVGSYRWR